MIAVQNNWIKNYTCQIRSPTLKTISKINSAAIMRFINWYALLSHLIHHLLSFSLPGCLGVILKLSIQAGIIFSSFFFFFSFLWFSFFFFFLSSVAPILSSSLHSTAAFPPLSIILTVGRLWWLIELVLQASRKPGESGQSSPEPRLSCSVLTEVWHLHLRQMWTMWSFHQSIRPVFFLPSTLLFSLWIISASTLTSS